MLSVSAAVRVMALFKLSADAVENHEKEIRPVSLESVL